jgi:succinyl-CoA synthetase beta subunit
VVNKVLVAASVDIEREIYFAVLLDRATAAPLIVASTEGGVEIETVAEKSPEKIIREPIDPLAGLQPFQTANWRSNSDSSRIKSNPRRSFSARFIEPSSNPIARWWK